MIPIADVTPTVARPLPSCEMPKAEDISEEGFGYFRGTWFIGRVRLRDAEAVIRHETDVLAWLDHVASDAQAFELLAKAIEDADADSLPEPLRAEAIRTGLHGFLVDPADLDPLEGLEIGVAGLSHALSAVGCLTAASCRGHHTDRAWSDHPVVFFAAPAWRVELLADLISSERCGIDADRGMLTVYAASVGDMHRLAERILSERDRFRRMPDHLRPPSRPQRDDRQTRLPFRGV